MITYVICRADGAIVTVMRGDEAPNEMDLEMNTPEDGFAFDATGQDDFDSMDILDIHDNYRGDAEKKILIKCEA